MPEISFCYIMLAEKELSHACQEKHLKIQCKYVDDAEIEAFVNDHKKMFVLRKSKLSERREFKTAFDQGQGVSEVKGIMAGREIRALEKELEQWLKIK